jgi:hypothetical protein
VARDARDDARQLLKDLRQRVAAQLDAPLSDMLDRSR